MCDARKESKIVKSFQEAIGSIRGSKTAHYAKTIPG